MSNVFYFKLAFSGIVKNRKLYIPFSLTSIGMVMMYYIVMYLSHEETIGQMRGGEDVQGMLSLGTGVISVFAVIFLFYTHSFLIRRRKKEFGLYNVLGMDKGNLMRTTLYETVMLLLVSVIGGLACGILFSKIVELLVAWLLGADQTLTFAVDWTGVGNAALLFSGIFLLLLLNIMRQVQMAKPVELLRSENQGEKPPKANWVFAVLGIVILVCAYVLAVSVEDPLEALTVFFVAVLMVIVATYLLFISGSVACCRLLQKRKKFYYKTNHFVAVSSMAYRMKRNGAGLASICILSIMVLVCVSTTTCLFAGEEDILANRYPRDIAVRTESADEQYVNAVSAMISQTGQENGVSGDNRIHYRYLSVSGYYNGANFILDPDKVQTFDYSDVYVISFIPVEDYNELMGTQIDLGQDEAMLYDPSGEFTGDQITLEGMEPLVIRERTDEFLRKGEDAVNVLNSLYVFVTDMQVVERIDVVQRQIYGENASDVCAYDAFDVPGSAEKQNEVGESLMDAVSAAAEADPAFPGVAIEVAEWERESFYGTFGGLFLLGILLAIVFVCAVALIMYYKQVCEGYEDQSRFAIMKKVGMTEREIKRSINSQVLMVFFLPLLLACVHLGFAFPLIRKILLAFAMSNVGLLIGVTVLCALLFAVFYVIMYVLTSRAYYRIVNGQSAD